MYKPLRIVVFIVVVLAVVLVPLLANIGRVAADPVIALDTPEIERMDTKECIEPTNYMKAEHMHLLDMWRNEVIRGTDTSYVSSTGVIYDMSLEDTCFSCHSNRAEFCLSCHDYVGVETDCWSCHDGGEAVVDR